MLHLTATLLAILAGVTAAASLTQEVVTVGVHDDFFEPETVRIVAGTRVVWDARGPFLVGHTVTSAEGVFDSGLDPYLVAGDSFAFTFQEPGTYVSYCQFHGSAAGTGMFGVIVVEPAPTPSPEATATSTSTSTATVAVATVTEEPAEPNARADADTGDASEQEDDARGTPPVRGASEPDDGNSLNLGLVALLIAGALLLAAGVGAFWRRHRR